jgi:hypothetical protein
VDGKRARFAETAAAAASAAAAAAAAATRGDATATTSAAAADAAAAAATGEDAATSELEERASARRLRKIELSWKWSLLGTLESRLLSLLCSYNVLGFNAEGFDLIVLCSRLVVLAKELGLRGVRMQRDGGKIRWLKMDGLYFGEVKRLLSPGTSLASLARTFGLRESKGIFPFDLFTDLSFLDRARLPRDAALWASALNPGKSPSQEEVDEAQALFDERGFGSVGEYLAHYLSLDVVILQRAAVAMEDKYYEALGLDFVELRKFTVSSLSSCGAQHFLARNRRVGFFSPNHARMYSVSGGGGGGGGGGDHPPRRVDRAGRDGPDASPPGERGAGQVGGLAARPDARGARGGLPERLQRPPSPSGSPPAGHARRVRGRELSLRRLG